MLDVIIPHYNNHLGLERLLKSIPDDERINVIVVDDGSDDEHISKFNSIIKERRASIFYNNDENSAGTCRNIGLDMSDSDWVIFADSDDYFIEGALCKVLNLLTYSESDMIYFSPTSDDSGKLGKRHFKYENLVKQYYLNKNPETEANLKLSHNVPWSKVIRRKLIRENNIRFSETIVANDAIFSATCGIHAENIEACTDILYCVTHTENSLTTTKDISKYMTRLEVFIEYSSLLTSEQKRLVRHSAIPILYAGRHYGLKSMINSIKLLNNNNVPIYGDFKIDLEKIKMLFKGAY